MTSAVTTHVLDSAAGRPAAGIPVRLECDGDLGPQRLEPGTYRLTFDVDGHYPESFYPEITVTFRITDPDAHHHVPILLSPFAFTTYRGS
jgi:5-hydroxyisourate hydrolase